MARCTSIVRVFWNLSFYMQQIVLNRFFLLYRNYIYMFFLNLSKIIFSFIVFDVHWHILKNHDPLSYFFLHHLRPPKKDQRTICKQMSNTIDKDEYNAKTRHQFNDKLTLNFETIFLQKRYKWIFLQYL